MAVWPVRTGTAHWTREAVFSVAGRFRWFCCWLRSFCYRADWAGKSTCSIQTDRFFIYCLFSGIYEHLCTCIQTTWTLHGSDPSSRYPDSFHCNKTWLFKRRNSGSSRWTEPDQTSLDWTRASDDPPEDRSFYPQRLWSSGFRTCRSAFARPQYFCNRTYDPCSSGRDAGDDAGYDPLSEPFWYPGYQITASSHSERNGSCRYLWSSSFLCSFHGRIFCTSRHVYLPLKTWYCDPPAYRWRSETFARRTCWSANKRYVLNQMQSYFKAHDIWQGKEYS